MASKKNWSIQCVSLVLAVGISCNSAASDRRARFVVTWISFALIEFWATKADGRGLEPCGFAKLVMMRACLQRLRGKERLHANGSNDIAKGQRYANALPASEGPGCEGFL
jgi:hypothetical protein